MLNNFTQSLRIEVTPQALRLLRVRRWGKAAPQLLAEQPLAGASADELAAALPAALDALLAGQAVRGVAATFVLADDLVRMWQVVPPLQAARLADVEAAAALRFHTLYGESPAAWHMSADWSAAAPFMAAAVPRALQAALEATAARHALVVIAIVPHFVAAWNRHARALKRDAWFGVAHGNVLALAACAEGRMRALRHIAIPHGADHYWLTQTAQREALLLGLPAPALLQLSGDVPPALAKPASNDKHIATTALGVAA